MHTSLTCVCLCSVREEEAIQLDGLNAAQVKELREKSEKHVFQAEVNRMMKLIINSLYKNKEVSSCCISVFVLFRGVLWFGLEIEQFRVTDQLVNMAV